MLSDRASRLARCLLFELRSSQPGTMSTRRIVLRTLVENRREYEEDKLELNGSAPAVIAVDLLPIIYQELTR